jgi:hypothetical protein
MAKEEKAKRTADFYKEMILFFAVLFFTCVVGVITLLPELEHPYGLVSWGWLSLSILYFGLVVGIDYSLYNCFYLYEINRQFREIGVGGFYYPLIDDVAISIQKISKKLTFRKGLFIIAWFLIAIITLVFFL